MRSEAEEHNEPFRYTAGASNGTARILNAPPNLRAKKG
jgi:hypothetical protein